MEYKKAEMFRYCLMQNGGEALLSCSVLIVLHLLLAKVNALV